MKTYNNQTPTINFSENNNLKIAYECLVHALEQLGYITNKEHEIFLSIISYTQEEQCFPSRNSIADRARVSVKTVQRALNKFKKNGWLNWSNKWNGKLKTSNHYIFVMTFEKINEIANLALQTASHITHNFMNFLKGTFCPSKCFSFRKKINKKKSSQKIPTEIAQKDNKKSLRIKPIPPNSIKLEIPYSEKGEAKKLGAKWNGEQWYISQEIDKSKIVQWISNSILKLSILNDKRKAENKKLDQFLNDFFLDFKVPPLDILNYSEKVILVSWLKNNSNKNLKDIPKWLYTNHAGLSRWIEEL